MQASGSVSVPPAFARPLVPVVVALMAGLLAASWGLSLPRGWILPLLSGLWLGLFWGWWTDRRLLLLPLLWFFLAGAALYGQALAPVLPPEHVARLPEDQEITLRARVARPERSVPERLQLVVAAEAWLSPRGWWPVRGLVLVSAPLMPPPAVGSPVVVRGRLRVPRLLANPGAFHRPRQLAMEGIYRTLTLKDPAALVQLAGAEPPLRERLRGGVRTLLGNLSPEARAMYRALLLGEQGELTPAMRQAFSRTGTSHLLAISGLHLGMAAALTFGLGFWLLRCWPWLLVRLNALKVATFLAAGPVVGYAWLAGGSPSTQRAEIMVLAYLLVVLLGRPREVWSALSLAALVILVLNPLRLFSASFALSFSAVAGLLALVPRWSACLPRLPEDPGGMGLVRRLRRWLPEALLASLVASLATAPLVSWFFNLVSLWGFVVNLVAIPLILGLALPLGELAALAQILGLTPLAQRLLQVGEWPLWLGWQAIVQMSRLPAAAVTCPTPTPLQMALCYLVLLAAAVPRGGRWVWGAGPWPWGPCSLPYFCPGDLPGRRKSPSWIILPVWQPWWWPRMAAAWW